MGTCPQGSNWVTCILYLSQWSDIWINQDHDLPSFNVEDYSITVSGFSGGSYMATQIDIIYSDIIQGVGLFSGGTYGGKFVIFDPYSNDANMSLDFAKQMESQDYISPLNNAIGKPVWIHSGLFDKTVPPQKQESQRDFYKQLGANVTFVQDKYSHVIPQIRKDYCIPQGYSYGSNCGYDGVGQMFKTLYRGIKQGKIQNLKPMDLNWEKDKKGVLRKFSQFSLTEASLFDWHGLDEFGYIFYPKQCADGSTICKLHIHFHGCTATLLSSSNGYNYITKYGFNEYAISNNIIIVFPQARFNLIYNQNDCWDFYGYSSILNPNQKQYLTNQGVQAKFVKNLIERIKQPLNIQKYKYFTSNILEYNHFQKWFEFTGVFIVGFAQNLLVATIFSIYGRITEYL